MISRYLHHVNVEQPPSTETAVGARVRLAEKFPRTALRRMTHLGLLLGATLEGVPLRPDDAVIYASKFGETRALEDYLRSFPTASPLLFQTSIHPGAVQQVLIGRQQPIARLWPMTGGARLVEQAMQAALLEPAARTLVVGGEERGSWLLEQGVAAADSFALAMVLTREPAGALAVWRWEEEVPPAPAAAVPSLAALAGALAARRALAWGGWSLTWL